MANPSLDSLPPLREVVARFELSARKGLGQHFLLDLNLTRRIAECAGDLRGCTVFEIGAGPGGLTRALLATDAEKVIAIEKDRRCIAALDDLVRAAQGRLEIIGGDALKIDLTSLALEPRATPQSRLREAQSSRGICIVANLPYNVGTELLLNWLKQIDAYRSLTLMFQAEVANRIAAAPGSKAYGRLSVIAQFCCDVKRVMDLPARAFTPPPKVDSAVVHLTPRKNRPDITLKQLETVTAAAFGQRRKMLRSSLKPLGGEELLKRADIDPTLRAENLSLADFEKLAGLAAISRP